MKVISVLMQKGGSGKTTLVQSLAVAASHAGQSVAVIDLDPQATACNWGDRRTGSFRLMIVSIQPARLQQALDAARADGADLVIIDTPPRAADAAMAAAQAADLILIPARPTINDLETLATTRALINGAGAAAPVAVLLNAVPPQGPQKEQALTYIRDLGLPVLGVAFGHRAAYTHAAILGGTAQEYDPRGKAAEEIKHLYQLTCKLVDFRKPKKEPPHAKTARTA
jgi:chromosome partitioning protein